ncbi:hypothetical protein ACFV24_31290 [Nocardia fluminea]|uniref:hypothetical protein n=1 Tax=Nocardia fluminea TaxID=134984 RepID=UPI00366A8A04
MTRSQEQCSQFPKCPISAKYWLGLGMRSGLLSTRRRPSRSAGRGAAAVLGVWPIVGLLLAPTALRRAARHESRSSVAVRREKAMQRAF